MIGIKRSGKCLELPFPGDKTLKLLGCSLVLLCSSDELAWITRFALIRSLVSLKWLNNRISFTIRLVSNHGPQGIPNAASRF